MIEIDLFCQMIRIDHFNLLNLFIIVIGLLKPSLHFTFRIIILIGHHSVVALIRYSENQIIIKYLHFSIEIGT